MAHLQSSSFLHVARVSIGGPATIIITIVIIIIIVIFIYMKSAAM